MLLNQFLLLAAVLFCLGVGWVTDLLPGGGPAILGALYILIGLAIWARASFSGCMLASSMISCLASSRPYQPSTRTHLPSSRSL